MVKVWLTGRSGGYVLAVVSAASVLFVRVALERMGMTVSTPFLLFPLSVVLPAWYGGFRPGLLATLLDALVISILFLPPLYSIAIDEPQEMVPLLAFLSEGVLISILGELKIKAIGRQAEATDAVRRHAAEQTRLSDNLRESQQMLQLVLDTIPARVFWKDRNCVYLGCNRWWPKMPDCLIRGRSWERRISKWHGGTRRSYIGPTIAW